MNKPINCLFTYIVLIYVAFIYIVFKYHLGYFGKVCMQYFHKLYNKFHCLIINIDNLWSLIPQDVKDKASTDNAPLIDVTQFGYFKVLGKGVLPSSQRPIVVKAKLMSKIAKKNI